MMSNREEEEEEKSVFPFVFFLRSKKNEERESRYYAKIDERLKNTEDAFFAKTHAHTRSFFASLTPSSPLAGKGSTTSGRS